MRYNPADFFGRFALFVADEIEEYIRKLLDWGRLILANEGGAIVSDWLWLSFSSSIISEAEMSWLVELWLTADINEEDEEEAFWEISWWRDGKLEICGGTILENEVVLVDDGNGCLKAPIWFPCNAIFLDGTLSSCLDADLDAVKH